MEENIEVKDVQKTEYLNKNGLDMLWAKVKENTNNQVEVEYNRAKAKEDSLSQEIASVKPDEGKSYIQAKLTGKEQDGDSCYYDVAGDISFKSEYSDSYSGPITKINKNGIDINFDNEPTFGSTGSLKATLNSNYNITMQGRGRLMHDTRDTFNEVSMQLLDNVDTTYANSSNGNSMLISQLGIFYTSQSYALTSNDLLTGHGSYKTIGTDIAPLENGKVPEEYLDLSQYAKKTDIPEVGTSDFASKTTTDRQIIRSPLIIKDTLYVDSDISVSGDRDCKIKICDSTNSSIYSALGYNFVSVRDSRSEMRNASNSITSYKLDSAEPTGLGDAIFSLDESGVRLLDGDDNHVLTSNGSTIDITEYVKKSEITTGGNVDDVQVNGVSVVENKIANIKPATKEGLGVVKVGDGLNVTDGTISVDPEYFVNMKSYGVEWDTTVADPACTRIGNMSYHKSLPIQSEYKGCLVKNGKVNYYLDPNDWSKKADGTPSVLDGTDGDVMVHIPKFYGKSGSNGNKRWVRIATTKIDSSWVEIPEMFVSAYHNTIYTDGNATKVASVVSTDAKYRGGGMRSAYDEHLATDQFKTDLGKPVSGIKKSVMRTYATAAGQELLCYEFYKWIFYWNYVIEYANFNSQKEFNSELTSDGYHQGGLGPGMTTFSYSSWGTYNERYAITPCGYTNEFGNFSGVKTIQIQSPEITLYANRWRGFENPFGDISTNLEGIIIKRDTERANSNVYTTTDISKYGEDYSLFNIAGVEIGDYGWIKTFDIGSKAEIIPSSVDGSQSTYKCDFIYCNPYLTVKRWLCVGGNASMGTKAGLGFLSSDNDLDGSGSNVGFRSVIRA